MPWKASRTRSTWPKGCRRPRRTTAGLAAGGLPRPRSLGRRLPPQAGGHALRSEMLRRRLPGDPAGVRPQSVAGLGARVTRLSRDYLDLCIRVLTCNVRTLKGISEVHVILPSKLKKPLHDAIIKNSLTLASPQVLR